MNRVVGWISVIGGVLLIVGWRIGPGATETNFAVAASTLFGALLVLFLYLAIRPQKRSHNRIAPGRVVAVIPAYNEDPDLLNRTIRSVLDGTVVPDVIHVVDDGSAIPVVPFDHPKVIWHRQNNGGKRSAQVTALRDEHADFILTVDSDSIINPDALEKALRALRTPDVQAVTGLICLLNHSQNLITRLFDLELVGGCLMMRAARSSLGALSTTSGAFSVYRAEIILDNLDDYVNSGTAGDDRRLTHYALARGRVVALEDAVVWTSMPSTISGIAKQRLRWYKSFFYYLPWELRYLDGYPYWLKIWQLMSLVLWPIGIVFTAIVVPIVTGYIFWPLLVYWLIVLYLHTVRYTTGRPNMPALERVATWLFLTPLLLPWNLFIVRPMMYAAIFRVRSKSWHTRGESIVHEVTTN